MMEKQKVAGYIMAGVGIVMILISALGFFLNGELKSPSFGIIGLVLVIIGTWTIRKSSSNQH
ncbi:MAG: hypothetical protein CVV34_05785 [Methanomicrobiales archaeon HGW-Methanomicrobiales-5]|jgi:multidrug transporter EmrE-like cation transporter|nr:MAG: hypothetical protein CVV34_05785 [Methanomicrobiales archaeon HGW-Methanomicrobiales-5]